MNADTPASQPASSKPRKGRPLAIYALAFVLLALLEAGRLVPGLERRGADFPSVVRAAGLISLAAEHTGLAALSEAETRLVDRLNTDQVIGELPEKTGTAQRKKTEAASAPSPGSSLPTGETGSETPRNPVADALDQLRKEAERPIGLPPRQTPEVPHQTVPEEGGFPKDGKTKVMIVGDSMIMEGFGPVLQRTLRARPDLEVVREGKYSTGLTRPDQLDWPAYLRTLLEKHRPEVIIVCLGANDPQDIIDNDQKRHITGSPSWQVLYKARAEDFLRVAQSRGASVIWSGLPVMGKPTYDKRIRILSQLQREACEAGVRCIFVDNRKTLAAPDGSYLTFATDAGGRHVRLRYKDKIHVTEDGGRLLAKALLPALDATLKKRETARTSAAHLVPSTEPLRDEPVQLATGEELRRAPARVEKRSFRSRFLGRETTYYAFVPGALPGKPAGDSSGGRTERFPVVYLLHGAGGSQEDWKDRAGDLLGELVNRLGLVVVIPSAGPFSWYADSPLNPRARAESYMMEELIPQAEKQLPVLPRRGIAGLSMGGHGAFVLGFRHPGLFESLSSMSGILDITRHPDQWRIKNVLGPLPAHRRRWEEHSAFVLALKQRPATAPAMLFSTGSGDTWAAEDNRLFAKRLTRLGLRHEYHVTPGRHNWTYWREELPRHLAFHARILNAPAASPTASDARADQL